MTVFHPRAWLPTPPPGAKFYLSKDDLRIEHPGLSDAEIVSTAYSGPVNAETCVLTPVAPKPPEPPQTVDPIVELQAILDSAPVLTEDVPPTAPAIEPPSVPPVPDQAPAPAKPKKAKKTPAA